MLVLAHRPETVANEKEETVTLAGRGNAPIIGAMQTEVIPRVPSLVFFRQLIFAHVPNQIGRTGRAREPENRIVRHQAVKEKLVAMPVKILLTGRYRSPNALIPAGLTVSWVGMPGDRIALGIQGI